jgi:hypothetical protein
MRNKHSQIYHSAIGGYAVESAFSRRARVLASIRRVIDWVVVA